jgi:acyl carrier protein
MNQSIVEAVLNEEIHRIAPEIDFTAIDRDADLQEEFDIDSMDFLNLVMALSNRLNIEMPEADYAQMSSFNAMIGYLETHTS